MYNVKTSGGSFKGIIGECLFKLSRKNVVITKFFNKNKYVNVFGKYLSLVQVSFLLENWHSLDAIEIVHFNGHRTIVLYEVKSRNRYLQKLPFKPKMTLETHNLYTKARSLGFIPQIATVWLLENWDYAVEITEFSEELYCIDKPKRYDKGWRGVFKKN